MTIVYALISIVGSIASIVSLLIYIKGKKKNNRHASKQTVVFLYYEKII